MRKVKATIKDVAREAGVSISVVSYVLNKKPGISIKDETKARVIAAAGRLEYIADSRARGMKTKKSGNIAFAAFWNISDSVFSEVLRGIYSVASTNDYLIVLSGMKEGREEFAYLDLFRANEIDGVIIFCPYEGSGYDFNESEHADVLRENSIPGVFINNRASSRNNQVRFDYRETAFKATEHLIEEGHSDIGYLLSENTGSRQAVLRYTGYKEAMAGAGLSISDKHIYAAGDYEKLANDIISGTGPSGLVVNKILYAPEIYKCFSQRGIIVPDDISIACASHDSYAAYMNPPVSSAKIRLSGAGEKAAKTLMENINGNNTKCSLLEGCDVLKGGSVKKYREYENE